MSRKTRLTRNPEKFFAKYGKKFSNLFAGAEEFFSSLSDITVEQAEKNLKASMEILREAIEVKTTEQKESPVETAQEEEIVEEKPKPKRRARKTSTTTKKPPRKTSTTTRKKTTTRKPRVTKTKKEE